MTKPITRMTSFTIPPQVMSRLVGDETVLLDLASGMYFGLDGVGKRIWDAVADGKNCEEVTAIIASEYDVEKERAQEDVIEFLSRLTKRELLLID